MNSPLRLLKMKRPLILSLLLLGALTSTGCASRVRTVLAPIPVSADLRRPCPEAVQPADPVTASSAMQFGDDAANEARCWRGIALGALGVIDTHNEAAGDE